MITIHKIIEIQRTIWIDNEPTDTKEPRTLVCFKRTKTWHGLKDEIEFGSMILNRGVTVEQAVAALRGADLQQLRFVERNDDGFYKVVL